MGLFSKKADPILSKEKALKQQLAVLEAEIKQLNSSLTTPTPAAPRNTDIVGHAPQPAVQSTALPRGQRIARSLPREPIFESVHAVSPQQETASHFNDLGVRKYDLRAAWRRVQRLLHGPSAHNPKLVSYLAAGSIRGLRPLRYEKRIARNRFVVLTLFFLFILYTLFGWLRP
jgi:hypothetical protein